MCGENLKAGDKPAFSSVVDSLCSTSDSEAPSELPASVSSSLYPMSDWSPSRCRSASFGDTHAVSKPLAARLQPANQLLSTPSRTRPHMVYQFTCCPTTRGISFLANMEVATRRRICDALQSSR